MAVKKCPELTVMSGIAIIFVLLIHSCGSCLGNLYPGMEYAESDAFLLTLRNLVTPAVPMFLFASGFKYALHDSDTPYRMFLKKRLPRVLMSFFIINTIFWIIDSIIWMEHFDAVLLLKTYISSWLGNTVAYPLWYIPMYCCVIIFCPLMCRVIKKSWIRFLIYLVVGCAQQVLETQYPLLGRYPIAFIAYPTFFELGVMAHDYDFFSRLKGKAWVTFPYVGLVVAISAIAPVISRTALMQYCIYSIWGTLVCYSVCIYLSENKLLMRVGLYSYPLFLFHEPVIGRLIGSILKEIGISVSGVYVTLWTICTFLLTILLAKAFEFIKMDSVLWKFSLRGMRGTTS